MNALEHGPSGSLGASDLRQMQAAGWRFDDRGLRLGNCWAIWAQNPEGHLQVVFVADPDDEPEKFRPQETLEPAPQLSLNL